MRLMERNRLAHGGKLALKQFTRRAGAGSNPVFRRSAEKRQRDGRRNRGIADAHFADAQEVGSTGNRFHAEGHGRSAGALIHGWLFRYVARRMFQRQIENFQPEIVGDADLVDRRAPGCKIFDHLCRHARRKRRDVLGRDAMIAGKHRNQRAIDLRRALSGPCGKPCRDLFHAPQRTCGLRQRSLTLANGPFRPQIRPRQIADQFPEIVKGRPLALIGSVQSKMGDVNSWGSSYKH